MIDGVMTDPDGNHFAFEIVNKIGSAEVDSIVAIYADALSRLGITPVIASSAAEAVFLSVPISSAKAATSWVFVMGFAI